MRITDFEKNKTMRLKGLRGIAKASQSSEDILKGKLEKL